METSPVRAVPQHRVDETAGKPDETACAAGIDHAARAFHARVVMNKERIVARVQGQGAFWTLSAIVWMVFALLSLPVYLPVYSSDEAATAGIPLQVLLALILCVAMGAVYRRFLIAEPFRLMTALWLVVLGFCAAGAHSLLVQGVYGWLGWLNPAFDPVAVVSVRWKILWIFYMAWSFGYFWILTERDALRHRHRAERAEHRAGELELQLLRSQLDPHFLFNSLNEIAADIPDTPETARAMVVDVADYLRYSLDHRNQAATSVGAEFAAMRDYLHIEQSRRPGALRVLFDVNEGLTRRELPFFLLQPLVENAVKHAVPRDGRVEVVVRVDAPEDNARLCLEVANTGALTNGGGEGVGLSTLRRRLELHYPERHHFELVERDGMVHARIVLEGKPCFA